MNKISTFEKHSQSKTESGKPTRKNITVETTFWKPTS